jgi:catechol 2,3-dioxygenase-like lactoylglutathione lyase family enzyme
MRISHISIVSIPVSDQLRAKAFYCDVLGFAVIRDDPFMPTANWVQLGPPGAQTQITLVTWFENMKPGGVTGMVLETDDIDAAYAELKAHGLEVGPIEAAPWGRYVTLQDPDGNGWVLQTSAGM